MDLPSKALYLNRLQLTSSLQNPNIEVCISGRAGGKSNKKAWRYHRIIQTMPMSVHGIYSKTYKSLLTNTISPLMEALARIGYHRDIHYVIGQKPPASWELAPNAPAKFDYYIAFREGTGFRIMSEDREDSWRGPSIDGIDVDEIQNINKMKFENGPLMANRGNKQRFEKIILHHGINLDGSMPATPGGQWVLEFSKYYEEDGNRYWVIWNKIVRLQMEFLEETNANKKNEILREWISLRKQLQFYKTVIDKKRGTTLMFSFFNAFDNIKNVGIEFIENAKRIMSPMSFRIEMLNERMSAVENCFYNINEDVHLYDAYNNSLVRDLDYNFSKIQSLDSRADLDVDPNAALDLCIDYGHHINAMRICQEHRKNLQGKPEWQYRFLKSMYVKPPEGIPQLVANFCRYYAFQNKKRYVLWHDHTEVGAEGWRVPHLSETMKELAKYGWTGELKYVGKAPDHRVKHLLWFVILSETNPLFPKVRLNRENDKEGILSMQLAGVRQGRIGIEKDKSSERSKVIPREQATDLSDAGDIPLWGRYGHLLNKKSEYIGII